MPSQKRLSGSLSGFLGRVGYSTLARFTGLSLQLIGSILLARVLGGEGFGAYTYAFTWAMLLGALVPLGYNVVSVREVPGLLIRHEHSKVAGFLIANAAAISVMGVCIAGLLALLERHDMLTFTVGWQLVAVGAVVQALLLSLSSMMNILGRVVASQVIENIVRQMIFLSSIVLLFQLTDSLTEISAYVTAQITAVIAIVIMLIIVWRSLPETQGRPAYGRRLWLFSALPLMAWYITTTLQTNMDVVMVGLLTNDLEVGRYRTAARAVELILIANAIAMQVLGPMLSRMVADNDHTEAQKIISQCALLTAVTGFGLGAVFYVFAEWYLALFSPEFVAASTAMRILITAQFISLFFGPVAMVSIILGQERLISGLNIASLICNFGLNWLLIPLYGINGAAIATFVSLIGLKIALVIVIVRQTPFDPTPLRWLRRTRGAP